MKLQLKTLSLAIASSALLVGTAWGESQMGVQPIGTPTNASAGLNLAINVPNIVMLKVGAAGATVSTATMNVTSSAVSPGLSPVYGPFVGNNTVVDWDGTTAPTLTSSTSTIPVAAWTNTSNAVITCTTALIGFAGADIVVGTATGSGLLLPHPLGATNLTCGGATAALNVNTLYNSNYTYTAGSTLVGGAPGAYTGTVTYTITGGV